MFGIKTNNMKIGILTQPLRTNYGGLLQAYALQTILKQLGHDVTIIDRCYPKTQSLLSKILRVKNIIIGRDVACTNANKKSFVEENTSRFISKNYKLSNPIYTTEELKAYQQMEKLGAIIVGSDQVWRPRYSPNIYNYFLDFAEGKEVKRYSYAASFGVDNWEYNQHETEVCSKLAKLFDKISVREASAVNLCKEHLGVEAEHVLDPTLLLSQADYKALLKRNTHASDGNLFTYILDAGAEKQSIINKISEAAGLKPYICMPKLKFTYKNAKKSLNDCQFPAVEQWIQSFIDAEMVITDSFHGTAFSIIFNKPFWVLGNPRRGNTRMESLLATFNLKERIISSEKIDSKDLNASINWESVNAIKEALREKSIDFLTSI